MTREQLRDEINRLELAEKLLLVEELWDMISEAESSNPMPEWQKEELDRRYQEYLHGKTSLHDWQSVHEDLRRKYE